MRLLGPVRGQGCHKGRHGRPFTAGVERLSTTAFKGQMPGSQTDGRVQARQLQANAGLCPSLTGNSRGTVLRASALAAGERLIVPLSPDSAPRGSQSRCGQLALAPQQLSLCVSDGRCPGQDTHSAVGEGLGGWGGVCSARDFKERGSGVVM